MWHVGHAGRCGMAVEVDSDSLMSVESVDVTSHYAGVNMYTTVHFTFGLNEESEAGK